MIEILSIAGGLAFAVVALFVTLVARSIRAARDHERLHHELLQLKSATEELQELNDLERARELWRWNNPDAAALALQDRMRTGMRIGKMLD